MNFHFQLILIFFGLDRKYKEIQLEQIYILIKHLGFSYKDAFNLNIAYRKWFIDRYVKELDSINKIKDKNKVTGENIKNLNEFESMLDKKFSNDI
jgi:uncharacterized protein (UPF0305 family)